MSWSVRAMAVALFLTLAAAVPRSAEAVVIYWNPHKVQLAAHDVTPTEVDVAMVKQTCDIDVSELGIDD